MKHPTGQNIELRITGKELEEFARENPTAWFWISTAWGDRQMHKDGETQISLPSSPFHHRTQGWYIRHPQHIAQYFNKAELEAIIEIQAWVP